MLVLLLCVLSVFSVVVVDACPAANAVMTLDASVKADILARHNAERAKANGYVPALVWDTALETTAQNWAARCNVAHNGNRATDTWGSAYDASDRTKSVGENIANANGYYVGEYGMNFFIGEGANYNCQTNTCSGGTGCGHYTQLMWARTTKVGCAIVNCASAGQFLVCDYGEAGNYNNERPFPVEGCYSYTAPPAAQYGCGPFFLGGSPAPSSPPSSPTWSAPPTPAPTPVPAPVWSPPPTPVPAPVWSPPPASPPSGARNCGLAIPGVPAGYYQRQSSSWGSNNNGVQHNTASAVYAANDGSGTTTYNLVTDIDSSNHVSQTRQTTASTPWGGSSTWTDNCYSS